MLPQSTKMQKPFQLAFRTCLLSYRSCIFPCIKGKTSLHPIRQKKISLVLSCQSQHLHMSAPFGVSKEGGLMGKTSSQPEDPQNKEPKGENLTTSAGNFAREIPIQPNSVELDPLQDKSISLVQRFKKTFKQYGKVLIPVHLLTSSIWFGTFYYAALKLSKVIATPARYTVTLGGTSITVKYLRKHGYMSTPPPVKDYIQDRMEETKERISGKMEETRDMISGKMEETKEKLTEKMEETKERITEKIQETKEKVSFIKKKE
ncbi:hypothetical protein E2320_011248 [Naja naja]|nr:hypothetical protein E2320_011248 [Naja naja]